MDIKTLSVLEYPKILERLASNRAFSASADSARNLKKSFKKNSKGETAGYGK